MITICNKLNIPFVTIKTTVIGLTFYFFFEGEGEVNFILQKIIRNTEIIFSKIVYTFQKKTF